MYKPGKIEPLFLLGIVVRISPEKLHNWLKFSKFLRN